MKTFWISGWNREEAQIKDETTITVFVSKKNPRSMNSFEVVAVKDIEHLLKPPQTPPQLFTKQDKILIVVLTCLLIAGLLTMLSCTQIPKDEAVIENDTLKIQCEIKCFPKAVRWNFVKSECVCLPD